MVTSKKKTTKKTALKAVENSQDVQLADAAEDIIVMDDDENDETSIDLNLVKKKAIYDHVAVATGLRKRDVREAVDSMLEYLHSCLTDGKNIQIPPLGKVKVVERGSGDKTKVHYKLMLKKTDNTEKKSV